MFDEKIAKLCVLEESFDLSAFCVKNSVEVRQRPVRNFIFAICNVDQVRWNSLICRVNQSEFFVIAYCQSRVLVYIKHGFWSSRNIGCRDVHTILGAAQANLICFDRCISKIICKRVWSKMHSTAANCELHDVDVSSFQPRKSISCNRSGRV